MTYQTQQSRNFLIFTIIVVTLNPSLTIPKLRRQETRNQYLYKYQS